MRTGSRTDHAEARADDVLPAELLRLGRVDIDDWSDVRYVHATAFRTLIAPRIAAHHAADFLSALETPEYAVQLDDCDLTGAWVDGRLAGTAGWRAVGDNARVARLEGLFVLPMFTFMGLGSLLLAHAETHARRAGCTALTALATVHSVPFFMRCGYDVFAQGPGLAGLPGDMDGFLMRKVDPRASRRPLVSADLAWLEPDGELAESAVRAHDVPSGPDRLPVED